MKKIRDFDRYLRSQNRAIRRSRDRRAHRRSGAYGARRTVARGSKDYRDTTIIAPTVFSLMENPEQTLGLFEEFDDARRNSDSVIFNYG